MGIPYYVASLLRQHKQIQTICNRTVETDVLGIDFNCFLHKYLDANNPIGSVVLALERLLTEVVQAKKVLIAFDGLVPYAKMVQQRYRRMRRPTEVSAFDKHQISPATPYMRELADTLRVLFPHVEISDTLEHGEGEHKIFTWLRKMNPEDRKRICIYGLDADLVLISIAQHSLGSISILREVDEDFATLSISEIVSVLPTDPDTYVRMAVTCFGNDFLPNLAVFSLREDGHGRALHFLRQGTTESVAREERHILCKRAKTPRVVAPDGHAVEARLGCQLMDGVVDWEPVVYAFRKTVEWVLHYFKTSEILDWNWYYPYPEAPLVETLCAYSVPESFEWTAREPAYTVEDQLRFILPESNLQTAGLESRFPDELYDEGPDSRVPWMRRFAWESDPWISLPGFTQTSCAPLSYEAASGELKFAV